MPEQMALELHNCLLCALQGYFATIDGESPTSLAYGSDGHTGHHLEHEELVLRSHPAAIDRSEDYE